ncbi:hypothetical protein BU23DRAFT_208492 [Bimuria novae-zelandiae CBS 107.79]|uniref:Uncharacterized protein n=1 Tax=Bimuria novae-zelandiae CBS 107.79 TaxID=1447943 RepID=A0A6A5UZT1_9PLEO|nr:hypothetical protein BU23DRAFT_208492 [Bimuria novae-zelandiae CBS 107.79]
MLGRPPRLKRLFSTNVPLLKALLLIEQHQSACLSAGWGGAQRVERHLLSDQAFYAVKTAALALQDPGPSHRPAGVTSFLPPTPSASVSCHDQTKAPHSTQAATQLPPTPPPLSLGSRTAHACATCPGAAWCTFRLSSLSRTTLLTERRSRTAPNLLPFSFSTATQAGPRYKDPRAAAGVSRIALIGSS